MFVKNVLDTIYLAEAGHAQRSGFNYLFIIVKLESKITSRSLAVSIWDDFLSHKVEGVRLQVCMHCPAFKYH